MTLQEFTFSPDWFEDEVREGFFVSATMKRVWAGQLEVLREIDAVCNQLGLRWYIDSGTLLGAVRHHGFVPWDDDMDISMTRQDLEVLRAHAKELLPEGYVVMDPRDIGSMQNDVFRIISAKGINFAPEYLKKYHCPFSLGIDIFALDNYSNDESYEKKRSKIYRALMNCREQQWNPEAMSEEDYRKELEYCERETGVALSQQDDLLNAIVKEQVMVACSCEDSNTDKVKLFFGNNEFYIYDREWYKQQKMLEFEGIEMPAPVDYEKVLYTTYGNRKYIGKNSAGHNYPIFSVQEEKYLKDRGHYPLRYTYSEEDLHIVKDESPRLRCKKLLDTLGKVQDELTACGENASVREQLLIGEQKLLVAVSGILAPIFPNHSVISENLCLFGELVFEVFSAWDNHSLPRLNSIYAELRQTVEQTFAKRKEIVFLPCRAQWWPAMEKLWKYACELSNANVHVCPIPWYEETEIGKAGEKHDESNQFPSEVAITKRTEIDLASFHPEAIVVQVPFDNLGTFMMLDPENCTEQLKKWTDKLIYVPCYMPDTPDLDDGVGEKALSFLIEQPAVMHADEVRVPTSRMREMYIDTLTKLSSEDRRVYWEQKIKADDQMEISMRDTIFTV